MMTYQSLTMDTLCDRLCVKRNTLILFHARPDADAVGSAFALRDLLFAMGIPAMCACVDEVPDRLRFLSEHAQGSVLLDEDMGLDHERVISVDSASPEQLGSLFERLRRDVDLMIDHHSMGRVYADHYVDATASATGEIIYEIAKHLCERGMISEIPHRVLEAVYAAICSDTGSFRFANVTPKTFRIAAELLEAGVEGDQIARNLYEAKSPKQIRAEGEAARRLLIHDGGLFASTTIPYTSKFSLMLADEDMETIIDIPRSVRGVEVAFSVKQLEQKPYFRVSMRSSGDFDVSAVCARFGGGGHKRASGCSLEASNIDEAENLVLAAVREEWNRQNASI